MPCPVRQTPAASSGAEPQATALHSAAGSISDSAQPLHLPTPCAKCARWPERHPAACRNGRHRLAGDPTLRERSGSQGGGAPMTMLPVPDRSRGRADPVATMRRQVPSSRARTRSALLAVPGAPDARRIQRCAEPQATALHPAAGSISDSAQPLQVPTPCAKCARWPERHPAACRMAYSEIPHCGSGAALRVAGHP